MVHGSDASRTELNTQRCVAPHAARNSQAVERRIRMDLSYYYRTVYL